MRNRALIRVLSVLRLFQENDRTWTRYDLAEEFHVTPKTIARDLAALKAAGLEVDHVHEQLRGYCEPAAWRIRDPRQILGPSAS